MDLFGIKAAKAVKQERSQERERVISAIFEAHQSYGKTFNKAFHSDWEGYDLMICGTGGIGGSNFPIVYVRYDAEQKCLFVYEESIFHNTPEIKALLERETGVKVLFE